MILNRIDASPCTGSENHLNKYYRITSLSTFSFSRPKWLIKQLSMCLVLLDLHAYMQREKVRPF